MSEDTRRDELAESLRSVRDRVDAACRAAGRDPDEVSLLAVTKTFPATDVALLADLGLRAFAENRVQEAEAKVADYAELRPDTAVGWHLVGSLQRNKAKSVARWAERVHSVDSERLITALDGAVRRSLDTGERNAPLDVLLQVSLDEDPEERRRRGGAAPEQVLPLAAGVTRTGGLRLRGLMAVAPLRADPESAFEQLFEIATRLRAEYPEARELSSGMSADLEKAIAHGSTCVRVGTALLGGRGLASR